MSKFLLLLGPSGVGKSAIIDELSKLDARFVYISPYMTRPLRPGERNKISVTHAVMDEMEDRGEFLVVNKLYGGIRYGTPRLPITQALAAGDYPVLDWPINRLHVMRQAFPAQLFVVYIAPPSLTVLRERLGHDGRDADGSRLNSAEHELRRYWEGEFTGSYDLAVVSEDGQVAAVAAQIYSVYRSPV